MKNKKNSKKEKFCEVRTKYHRKELFDIFYIYNILLDLSKNKDKKNSDISIEDIKKYIKDHKKSYSFNITDKKLDDIIYTLIGLGEIFKPKKGFIRRII